MADKLEWLDLHFTLLRYKTVEEAVKKENYKIRPDLAPLFEGEDNAEAMIKKLAECGLPKDACEFMCYTAHKRAAVWWGYRCAVSLIEELGENPAVERDIADIGADFSVKVPDFAKIKPPEPSPEEIADANAKVAAKIAEVNAEVEKLRAQIDPGVRQLCDEAVDLFNNLFKKTHGVTPKELFEKLAEKAKQDQNPIDPNSPIFKAADELKAKVQAVRKETVDKIKAVIPPKVPAHEKKVRDNAMDAVYRWVAAPDAENAQKCLDIGNETPDTFAGLLALCSFWAYGDLTPLGEQTVPAPPGLAANGVTQVLLKCALAKGGTRSFAQRFALYFQIGVDALTGKDTWEDPLYEGKTPHKETPPKPSAPDSDSSEYKRWK